MTVVSYDRANKYEAARAQNDALQNVGARAAFWHLDVGRDQTGWVGRA